jgi:anti-anti-sigma factor
MVVALEGALDIATAPQAAECLRNYLAQHGPNLVVDTTRLDFIDSKGIGALMGAAKAARDAGGHLYLPDPALPVSKILDMCGLTSLFPSLPPDLQAEREAPIPPPVEPKPRPAAAAAGPSRPMRRAA